VPWEKIMSENENEICVWLYDKEIDAYGTNCGNAHAFEAGGISENDFIFCPYCGKKILVKRQEDT
jgi:DNA-directed RNA polymerase subunit RPC12/RpoP